MSSLRSNSRVMFYAGCDDSYSYQQPYFLESCHLCHKALGRNCDIFMYRGNTPFCSDECRQEQIEIDEANLSSSLRSSLRSKVDTSKKSGTSTKSSVQTGTVAVAY